MVVRMKLFHRKIGSGEPLLILHGLFGSSDNWLSIAGEMKDLFQIYLLDARNHGRSPHSPVFNYPAMVEDVYEFLGDLNLRQVSMVGHSLGGMTAMNFALEYPHRVRQLAVIDIAPKKYPVHHQNIMDGLLSINPDKIKNRREADEQLALHIDQSRVRQFLLKNLYSDSHGNFKWRLNLPVIAQNLEQIGAGIQSRQQYVNPCLFIRGGLSDYILDEDEPAIKVFFPRSQIQTIPDTTHWLHAEDPDSIIAALRRFLNLNKNNSLH